MDRVLRAVIAFVVLALVIAGAYFLTSLKSKETVMPEVPQGEPVAFLTAPPGFTVSYYATGVPGARVMEFVPGGILVSQTSEGRVSLVEEGGGVKEILSGLESPHGLASRCDEDSCELYVATHRELLRYTYDPIAKVATGREDLLALSSGIGDRHKTRTIMFLPSPEENTLLISVGSSCNVCHDEGQRGKVIAYDVTSGEVSEYASGLRNAVFMALHPVNGMVFMTEMGRDGLGDDVPPDEVNIVDPGYGLPQNFGWPICYGKNIHDTEFDKNTYIRNPCEHPTEMPSWLDLQAHSAPLGLSFIPEEGWPEDMWFDLLIAYHGSWNRTEPTGYKIVKVDINGRGTPSGPVDFITGFMGEDGTVHGRPADIKALPGGAIYISDDKAGVIYRVSRTGF